MRVDTRWNQEFDEGDAQPPKVDDQSRRYRHACESFGDFRLNERRWLQLQSHKPGCPDPNRSYQ